MRTFLGWALPAVALAFATPAMAQDDLADEASMEAVGEMLAGMFQSEPLTAEQETRLPAARGVVGAMMPEGFYAAMMEDMMGSMMRPMMSMLSDPDLILGTRLDLDEGVIEGLSEDDKVQVLTMLDPAYDRRANVIIETLTANMGEAFAQFEGPLRDGLANAYAVRFDDTQLADIAAFFATPTGTVYASESMALFADPQVMSATMQAVPAMMGSFVSMEDAMEAAMGKLPAERSLDDLDEGEQARLAKLLGMSREELADVVLLPGKD